MNVNNIHREEYLRIKFQTFFRISELLKANFILTDTFHKNFQKNIYLSTNVVRQYLSQISFQIGTKTSKIVVI